MISCLQQASVDVLPTARTQLTQTFLIVFLAHIVIDGFFNYVLVGMIWRMLISDGFLRTYKAMKELTWRKLIGCVGLVEAI